MRERDEINKNRRNPYVKSGEKKREISVCVCVCERERERERERPEWRGGPVKKGSLNKKRSYIGNEEEAGNQKIQWLKEEEKKGIFLYKERRDRVMKSTGIGETQMLKLDKKNREIKGFNKEKRT